jgi:hypothetical protein
LVNRLTADGRYGDALAEWRAAEPAALRDGLLRDGDFAAAADGTVFTWSPEEGPGASAGAEAAPSGGGRALRVEYDGYSTPTLPRQMLVLPAGAYSLRWRELPAQGGGADALAWSIRCADDGRLLARSRAAAGAGGWTDARLTFETRPPGCAAQWLQLTASPGERRTTIVRWYGGLRLERLQ